MSFIQLPLITHKDRLHQYISAKYSRQKTALPFINKTLYNYINNMKCEIDNYQNEWDKFKKYTNPYEYIHTHVNGSSQAICKLNPLSRSYFKMIEICNTLSIINELPKKLRSFHLAEGPGGFVEALADMRKLSQGQYNPDDKYFGMTLLDDDPSVPGWKKTQSFIKKCPNFIIETGCGNPGDLMDPNNLLYCFNNFNGTIDLITADGGFDFSVDFNQQESVSLKLIFSQIAFATAMQKKGGSFIIKVFDTFSEASADMIHLLTLLYNTVYFIKPYTSRLANSEKYIVCKDFRLTDTRLIVHKFFQILVDIGANTSSNNLERVLTINPPYLLTTKLEECNAVCGQQQIECISNTLNLINNNKHEKLESLKRNNIQKCRQWCQKYKLPFYKNITPNNIFLHNNKI